jgi:hypothetical protein
LKNILQQGENSEIFPVLNSPKARRDEPSLGNGIGLLPFAKGKPPCFWTVAKVKQGITTFW